MLEWSQGMIRWFNINEKQPIIFDMIMMYKQSLINERVARHLEQERGVTWHVVAGILKFCTEFFFHQCATACMFYKNDNDFLLHFRMLWYGLYIYNILDCKWAITRWQWLLCMYINIQSGSKRFKSGGLHEKHVVACCLNWHKAIIM